VLLGARDFFCGPRPDQRTTAVRNDAEGEDGQRRFGDGIFHAKTKRPKAFKRRKLDNTHPTIKIQTIPRVHCRNYNFKLR
jgi:hypothetical protein